MISIDNPEIRTIYRRLRRIENHHTFMSMRRMGLQYARSHGVIINDIAQIAKEYQNRNDLATLLRETPVRELRIMAEMIDEHHKRTPEELNQIVAKIDNYEIAQQFALNFSASPQDKKQYALNWINIAELYPAYSAYTILSQTANNLDNNEIEQILTSIPKHPEAENFQLQKCQARCLRTIANTNQANKDKVLNFTQKLKTQNPKFAMLIEEVEPLLI